MSRYVKLDSHGDMIDDTQENRGDHASWLRVYIDYEFPNKEEFTDRLAMCSNCRHIDGKYTYSYTKMRYRRCPNCNAVMDGEVE